MNYREKIGKIKISSFIGILTILQFIYTTLLGLGLIRTTFFSIQHEDYIFIAHLMTWFIILAIERIQVNNYVSNNI